MMQESDIQKKAMVALTKNGCKVFRANAGKFRSMDGQHVIQGLPNGFFDLFGFRVSDHQVFFIEMKTKTGRPRESQKRFHLMLTECGIIHGIARSAEDAVKIVKEELVGYGFKDNLGDNYDD